MAEEWRVSLIFNDRPGVRASYYHRTTVRDLLRSRFGDDIAVSAEKMRIFLYAGTVDAAAEAEHVAREKPGRHLRSAATALIDGVIQTVIDGNVP